VSHEDRSVLQDRAGPLLARPVVGGADLHKEGVLVVDVGGVLRVRAAGGTATWRTLPGVSTCGSFGWRSIPAVKSISCVDTDVLLTDGTVPYVHACTCYFFDEPLDGAGADTSPTFNPG
jgi:hypothetical protein